MKRQLWQWCWLLACVSTLDSSRLLGQPDGVFVGGLQEGMESGEVLLAELNCVGCHPADLPVRTRLASKQPPRLGEVGARLNPQFLRAWLVRPAALTPGTTMPDLLHDLPPQEAADRLDSLVAFLSSLGRPTSVVAEAPSPEAVAQGRVLYHQIGCVACHPPQEAAATVFPQTPGGLPSDPDVWRDALRQLERSSAPLGPLALKYTVSPLTQFLLDPLSVRPAGRMPAMNLTTNEARAIAAYLLRQPPPLLSPSSSSLAPAAGLVESRADPARVARGRQWFLRLGCAGCHPPGAGRGAWKTRLAAPPLRRLQPSSPTGCLADPPPARIPRYALRPDQRLALRAALASQTRLAKRLVPAEQVVRTMVSLNCYACHVRDSVGGPSPNRADYFTVTGTWELGDEGRIPPHLSSVGTKLRPEWLGEVMTNRGIARPYMASRMPQYGGANVRDLLSAYRIAEAWSTPDPPPTHDPSVARIGRELVGKSRLSCITCHVFQGRRPEGLPALDMALMTRRLEWAWFRRYVLEPQVLRPGTRMPAFWPGGQAAYKDLLEGATARQVEAVWLYLSGGSGAEPPVGVGTASGAPIPQRD